ncbi:MAG: hypothetical protein ACRD98_00470 [Nitrososphaera sp.]
MPVTGLSLLSLAARAGKGAAVALPIAGASTDVEGLPVFHGSPHKFTRLSAEKIGTGEGGQAYGHGLYFAENPQVAREYVRSRPVSGRPEAFLYHADIPEEHIGRMLDWDKPLSEQPENVKQSLSRLRIFGERMRKGGEGTAGEAYSSYESIMGRRGAAEKLKNLGIPGIKYLDKGSRAGDNGTRNIVLFDERLARIIRRERGKAIGIVGAASGMGAMHSEETKAAEPVSGASLLAKAAKPDVTVPMSGDELLAKVAAPSIDVLRPLRRVKDIYAEEVSQRGQGVLGNIRYAAAPLTAAASGLVEEPVYSGLTGIGVPKPIARFTSQVAAGALPVAGITSLPGAAARRAVRQAALARAELSSKLSRTIIPPPRRASAKAPSVQTFVPGIAPARTKPLPVAPEALALSGEVGLAYHKALNPEVFKRAGQAGLEFFKTDPSKYNRALSVTENIGQYIGKSGGIDAPWLAQFGLQADEAKFVTDAYESMRQSAQSMAQMSKVSRDLGLRIRQLPKAQQDALTAAGVIDDTTQLLPWWRRADNILKGLMVSQLSTAMRNAETVVARLGMDTMTAALDAGIARTLRKTPTVHPMDGLETFMNTLSAVRPKIFRAQKDVVRAVTEAFPDPMSRLLARYNSDLTVAKPGVGMGEGAGEKVLRAGEKLADMANIWNRGQEFLIRRAVFQSTLAQQVRKTGVALDDVIKSGEAWRIPEEAVNKAVQRALEVTFAEVPKYGTAGHHFTQFMNKTAPFSSLAIPFPRFLVQSWKFLFDHSPAGFLKLTSQAERAKIAAGDASTIAKATAGSGLLGAAIAMREEQHEKGARWYEYMRDDGKIVDMRPFAPFSTYLFMAELLAQSSGRREGRGLDTKDITNGLLGVNLRAGTGLAIVDKAMESVTNSLKRGDVPQLLQQLSGEYLARATVPLAQLRDAYDEIVDGVSIARERAQPGEEFTSALKANIPGLSRTLPEVESPTQAGPYVTEHPFLLKQLTGVRMTPAKNAGATELDRLGFSRQEILPWTGNRAVDRKYQAALGPLVEEKLSAFVRSGKYQALPDIEKGVALRREMIKLRKQARIKAKLTQEERRELRLSRIPFREKMLLQMP